MAGKAAAAITPSDVARFGHIATLIRAELTKRDWKMADLAEAMGLERKSTVPYPWLKGYGAPGTEMRPKLAKVLGVPPEALMARQDAVARPMVATGGEIVAVSQARPQAVRTGDVLGFTVGHDGVARLRLDVSLPLETAKPLLRMLLDAGIVFGNGEVEG